MRPFTSARKNKKRNASRAKGSRSLRNSLLVFSLLLMSMILSFGVEWIQRGTAVDAYDWLLKNPQAFGINVLISLSVIMLFFSLIGSFIPSAGLAAAVMFLAALVSYFKETLRGEPLFPWDLLQKNEAMNIMPIIVNPVVLQRAGIVAGVIAFIFLLRLVIPRMSVKPGVRLLLGVVSIAVLYSFGVQNTAASNLINRAGVSPIVWNQQQNYEDNGMALAFTLNLKNSKMEKPENYTEDSIGKIAQTMVEKNNVQSASAPAAAGSAPNGKQPNVIFIMNEAFWDPTLLSQVSYSEDPVPTIHQLQKESTSGYLLSPQFGGGTSNVEFEVLSGLSMSSLPGGSVPYQQYIRKPLPSLASYFENSGYKSMAIHSYEGWYWNRQNVYKEMGFESFMSKQYFENPEIKGDFISDNEVSRKIIDQVDGADKPMFVYAVTMQNHGPYDDMRYGENSIKAAGSLTTDAKNILETYTQGARDADQSLKLLIDHYQESDEPTVIVFYGDHLPMLGMDYDVYKQAGFINSSKESDWTLEEMKKMHSIPFVVWSNYDLPQETVPTLSDSFLGSYVLNMLDMEMPATWAYNYEISRKVPGLLSNLTVGADGTLSRSVPEAFREEIKNYQQIQYDQLFGKQYLANFIDQEYLTKTPLSNYNAEFEDQTGKMASGASISGSGSKNSD